MRGCVGEASSSMDTAHSQRTKSTVRMEEKMLPMCKKKKKKVAKYSPKLPVRKVRS